MRGLNISASFRRFRCTAGFPTGVIPVQAGAGYDVSTMGLLAGFPVMLAIAIAVKWDSPGPVFYRAQESAARGGRLPASNSGRWSWTQTNLKADLEHMNERESVLFKIVNDPRNYEDRALSAEVFAGRAAAVL